MGALTSIAVMMVAVRVAVKGDARKTEKETRGREAGRQAQHTDARQLAN